MKEGRLPPLFHWAYFCSSSPLCIKNSRNLLSKMTRSSLVGFFLLLNLYGKAQSFEWSAPVGSPSETGFYSVPLAPKVIALSEEDLADLRIFDDKGKEVPYVKRKDEMSFDKQFFTPYEKV